MAQLLLLLALILFISFILSSKGRKQLSNTSPLILWRNLFYLLTAAGLVLFILGRSHWMAPLFTALAALTLQVISNKGKIPKASSSNTMSRAEALDILGLSGTPSNEEIIEAHRKLMQKVHPDQGGNDYLAAQLNQARQVLLADD